MFGRVVPSKDPIDREANAEVLSDAVWDALSECGFRERFDTTQRAATRLFEYAAYDLAKHDSEEAMALFIAIGMLNNKVTDLQERFGDSHDERSGPSA